MNTVLFLLAAAMGVEADALAAASRAFLETLAPEQREAAVVPFDDAYRFDWHFFPRPRRGVSLKEMDDAQRQRAMEVLQAGLSASGFETVEQLRIIEEVLQELERGNPARDPELFHFTVFDEPADGGTWGLRYEGHHISLNWTVLEGKVVSSTPQFLGSHPAQVLEGTHAGLRPLAPLQDLAFDFLASLDEAQRSMAIVAQQAPRDIFTLASSQAQRLEDEGIRHDGLNEKQQAALWDLIEAFAALQAPAIAEARLEGVKAGGLEGISFAWMGATERGIGPGLGHYYRVQGPGFLIEYDNIQDHANHIHAVWRDFDGDFGRDLIAEHRAAVPHSSER